MAYSLGKTDKKYVSAIDPMFDTREINQKVTDVANEDQLTDILNLADRKKPTQQPVYYTFVNEPVIKTVTVTSVTTNSAATVVIVLTAGTSGILQPGDILMFHDTNESSGMVSSVSTASGVDTVTIQSVNGGNLTVTAADVLSVYTAAVGENSINRKAFRTGNPKYSNKVQTFRVSSYITDIQNVSGIEVSFGGKSGYLIKDQIEKKLKLKANVNAAFWGGDLSATSYSDANPTLVDANVNATLGVGGGAVQSTRGIDKYTTAYGVHTKAGSGTPNGAVSKTDLDAHLDTLTAARAGAQYSVFGAKAVMRAYDDLFKNTVSAGAINSVRLMVDGNEIDFSVLRVKYSGYELNFAWMPLLDNPSLFSNYTIGKSSYFIPLDKKVKVQGGGYDPAIQVRYMPQTSKFTSNTLIKEIQYGADNPVNPNGTDSGIGCDYKTIQGLEVLGAQFFGKQQVLS